MDRSWIVENPAFLERFSSGQGILCGIDGLLGVVISLYYRKDTVKMMTKFVTEIITKYYKVLLCLL
jgi:hypothetical protein